MIVWQWNGPVHLAIERGGPNDQMHRLIAQDGRPGAVVIAERAGRILVVRQQRWASQTNLWEFPRGFADAHDDDVVETARRELAEETGFAAITTTSLGTIWADPGLLANPIEVVVARVEPTSRPTDGEISDARWLTEPEIDELIAQGDLRDAITLAALGLWRQHQRSAAPQR